MVNTSASHDGIGFFFNTHRDPCFITPGESKARFKNARQLHKCVDDVVDLYPGVSSSIFPHQMMRHAGHLATASGLGFGDLTFPLF